MAFCAAFASSWNWVVASGRDELAVLAAMVTPTMPTSTPSIFLMV